MKLEQLDYHIPKNLIATEPTKPRDESSLVVVNKEFEVIKFKEILNELRKGDTLVFNNTKVINAHLDGRIKKRKVSVNLNKIIDKQKTIWSAFLKSNKKPLINEEIIFPFDLKAKIIDVIKNNNTDFFQIQFSCDYEKLRKILNSFGKIPLPPYIKKIREIKRKDSVDYQTIFAAHQGAVAAPTAGLHFTDNVIKNLENKGVQFVPITLHVGAGTFLPVKSDNILEHKMHEEWCSLSQKSSDILNNAIQNNKRIISVGTTCLRVLETIAKKNKGKIIPWSGFTDLFITPGFKFNIVDILITNFHLPKSTLLMLISAFHGRKRVFKSYEYAIRQKYRFFSYGDSCIFSKENQKYEK